MKRKNSHKTAKVSKKSTKHVVENTTSSPAISVIIPVHNSGESAVRIINQALASFDDLEVIAVDDGSTDDSFDLLSKIDDFRVKVLRQPNSGPSSARNLGLQHAAGRYLAFLDSDDEISPAFLPTLYRLAESSPVAPKSPTDSSKSSANASEPLAASPVLPLVGLRQTRQNKSDVVFYTTPTLTKKPRETNNSYLLRLLIRDGRLYPVVNKLFRADLVRQNQLKFDEALTFGEDLTFVLTYLQALLGGESSAGPAGSETNSSDADSGSSSNSLSSPQLRIAADLRPLYFYHYETLGTAKPAARDWQNWEKNIQTVKTLLVQTRHEKRLFRLLKLRWRLSHLKAKLRTYNYDS